MAENLITAGRLHSRNVGGRAFPGNRGSSKRVRVTGV